MLNPGQQAAMSLQAALQSPVPLPPPPPPPPVPLLAPHGPPLHVALQLQVPAELVHVPEPVEDPTFPEQLRPLPPKEIEPLLTEPA